MFHQANLTAPVAAALVALAAHGALAAPDPAPATRTRALDHKSYTAELVAPHKGKVVFVDFWATYCLPCLDELPALLALRAKLEKEGALIAFVNVDPPGDEPRLRALLAKKNLVLGETWVVTDEDPQPFIEAVDPRWAGEIPFGALYGRDGKLLRIFSGEQKAEVIERAIRDALSASAAPAAPASRAPAPTAPAGKG